MNAIKCKNAIAKTPILKSPLSECALHREEDIVPKNALKNRLFARRRSFGFRRFRVYLVRELRLSRSMSPNMENGATQKRQCQICGMDFGFFEGVAHTLFAKRRRAYP
jgi:hypothetical protein